MNTHRMGQLLRKIGEAMLLGFEATASNDPEQYCEITQEELKRDRCSDEHERTL